MCLLASSMVMCVVISMQLPVGMPVGTVDSRDMRLTPKACFRLNVSLVYVVGENISMDPVKSRISACWMNENGYLIDLLVWL